MLARIILKKLRGKKLIYCRGLSETDPSEGGGSPDFRIPRWRRGWHSIYYEWLRNYAARLNTSAQFSLKNSSGCSPRLVLSIRRKVGAQSSAPFVCLIVGRLLSPAYAWQIMAYLRFRNNASGDAEKTVTPVRDSSVFSESTLELHRSHSSQCSVCQRNQISFIRFTLELITPPT